ncbi:NAD(P)/FAD-dependent oxidoreductase [Streptomyces sp. NPDC001661]
MRTVIVGSGIAGAAAGYELALGGVDVTLVDSRIQGRATSAGAGIICPWSSQVDDPDWYRFAVAGAEYYEGLRAALAADGESDLGYRKVGSLRLTTDEDAEDVLRRVSERAAASPLAGDVELVDARRARELFPPLGHEGPAVHIPGAARLDGRLVRDAMCRAAERHGARIVEGTAELVADGDGDGGAVRGVRVAGEVIGADSVIVAAGAWAPELLEPLGVHVRVEPQRGQIMHLRMPGTDTTNWPVVLPLSRHYLLAFDDSRVVVGATREDGSGFDHRVTAAGLKEVLDEALAVAPGLADATHVETRIGFRPVGPDIRPLLGTVPKVPGLVVVNGLGASGLTMGPYAGSVAARLARGAEPGLDLAAYDPLR